MNLRDNLLNQIYQGMLYRKMVIWMDLGIQSDEFVHQKVVEVLDKITAFRDTYKYVATKPAFSEVDLDTPGQFSLGFEGPSESVQNLDAVSQAMIEMENLIKKNFKLSQEKLDKFAENNMV